MEQVVVFGAGSGLGVDIVKYLANQHIEVYGVGRSVSKNPQLKSICKAVYDCDATQKHCLEAIVAQLPQSVKVISTMGSYGSQVPVDYIGHRYLIDGLEKYNIKRMVLITSLGCGDSWQYLSSQAKAAFGAAVREKSLAESWLTSSGLAYTIIRPGGLKNGDISEQGKLTQNTEVHGLISRAELARITHQVLNHKPSFYQVYECVDPSLNSEK